MNKLLASFLIDTVTLRECAHQTDIQRIEKRLKALFVTKLFKHIKK